MAMARLLYKHYIYLIFVKKKVFLNTISLIVLGQIDVHFGLGSKRFKKKKKIYSFELTESNLQYDQIGEFNTICYNDIKQSIIISL